MLNVGFRLFFMSEEPILDYYTEFEPLIASVATAWTDEAT